jgi:hypothetical protein
MKRGPAERLSGEISPTTSCLDSDLTRLPRISRTLFVGLTGFKFASRGI